MGTSRAGSPIAANATGSIPRAWLTFSLIAIILVARQPSGISTTSDTKLGTSDNQRWRWIVSGTFLPPIRIAIFWSVVDKWPCRRHRKKAGFVIGECQSGSRILFKHTCFFGTQENIQFARHPQCSRVTAPMEMPSVCRTSSVRLTGGYVVLACSGNSAASPSCDAEQTPRSVMSPDTSRFGVTSKAGFPPRVFFGVT